MTPFILKPVGDLIDRRRDFLPETSECLFDVLERASQEVEQGSELGNDDIIFCYRRLRLHTISLDRVVCKCC